MNRKNNNRIYYMDEYRPDGTVPESKIKTGISVG